ncbi:hypothetical protein G6011_08449 [Alternaria panax]|uniref:Uncharacterized protein n=1 Tax=Alternaria panax TaxID=48097 RepID=A0AAD4I9P8_9PLEO|nr:hypothetical protein G6011_08449 [Alternaria panax]
MPFFITPPRFGLSAAPAADPTSTSSATFPVSSLFDSSSTPLGPTPYSTTAAPPVEKQPAISPSTGLFFAAVSTDATGKPTTKRIPNPASILNGETQILRIYLSLEDLPPESLHGMFLHFQKQGANPLQEVHLCVRSLLRPCLQDIDEDCALRKKMLFMISEWLTFGTTVKFFFHRLGVDVDRDCFQNFVEKDLMRAIQGLKEHDVELLEILGEESWVYGRNAPSADAVGASTVADHDLDDEMI